MTKKRRAWNQERATRLCAGAASPEGPKKPENRVFGGGVANRRSKLLESFDAATDPSVWSDPAYVQGYALRRLDRLVRRAEEVGNYLLVLVCLRLAAKISPPPPHAQEWLDT
jgi:hypothetical protein